MGVYVCMYFILFFYFIYSLLLAPLLYNSNSTSLIPNTYSYYTSCYNWLPSAFRSSKDMDFMNFKKSMYVCMYACMYVCMYACVYACMYVYMYVYKWCYPKPREFDHKKFLIVTPSFHRLLQSSHLGHVYSDPSMFPMISCIPGSSQMCVDNLLRFRMGLLILVKTTPFQP
jgi:hypothetical protein